MRVKNRTVRHFFQKNPIVRWLIPTIKTSKEIKNCKNENDISLCIRASTPVDFPWLHKKYYPSSLYFYNYQSVWMSYINPQEYKLSCIIIMFKYIAYTWSEQEKHIKDRNMKLWNNFFMKYLVFTSINVNVVFYSFYVSFIMIKLQRNILL